MINIDSEVRAVLEGHRAGRGRRPVLPSAEVVERYRNGQPSAYSVGGQVLTRRQYHVLVRGLQDRGELPPRRTSKGKPTAGIIQG
jgi:hypothetical protein